MTELYTTAALHRMVRYDARREILNAVGDLSGFKLFGTNLIVAPYVQSGLLRGVGEEAEVFSLDALYERYEAKSGLLTQQLSVESIYQGKVYLVLAIGDGVKEPRYKVGDWIVTLQENTRAVSISAPGAKQSKVLEKLGVTYVGFPCKFLYDADVYMRIDDPDMVV